MSRAKRPTGGRHTPPVASDRVYWNDRHRAFFGKYKFEGRWKNKAVPVSIEAEDAALAWFRRWFEALKSTGLEAASDSIGHAERKTIRGLATRWLAWKRETLGDDQKAYRACDRTLEKWVLPFPIADVDLEREFVLGHCADWIESVKKARRASMTTRNIVQSLRGFLIDVRGKGWVRLRENPLLDPYVRRLVGPAETVAGRNTIIHLTAEYAKQLVACDSPKIPAVRKVQNLVAIATGCRLGELRALRWSDTHIDTTLPTIQVFRQVQFIGPEGKPLWKPPKRQSHRVIPLHPAAAEALRWWRQGAWQNFVGRSARHDDPVFPSARGSYVPSRAAALFRDDLKAAGLPTLFDGQHRFTFHACRRTFMSLLEAAGVARELIGALAGHAASGVADRHYIAKNLGRFHEAIQRLPLPPRSDLSWLR